MRCLFVSKILIFTFSLLICFTAKGSNDKLLEWGNEHVTFCFASSRGYDLVGLKDLHTGREILDSNLQNHDIYNFWQVVLTDAEQQQITLSNHSKATVTYETSEHKDGRKITIYWKGICDKTGNACANVTVTGFLPVSASVAEWRISVTSQVPYRVWLVRFPSIRGIRDLGDDYAILPDAMGRIVWDPSSRISNRVLKHPGYLSMQFLAAWGSEQFKLTPPSTENFEVKGWYRGAAPDEAGIYTAIHDADSYYKLVEVLRDKTRKSYGWQIVNFPAFDEWPLSKSTSPYHYEVPYAFAIGVFNGTAEEACELYRAWSLRQPWAERGPVWAPNPKARFPLSSFIRDNVFWGKFYHEPGKIVPELTDFRNYLRVPVSTHYYRYNIAAFDDNNPEFIPLDPYFRQGMNDLRAAGVKTMPYINRILWDMDVESWRKENAVVNAVKNRNGKAATTAFTHGNIMGVMSSAAPGWQKKLAEIAGKFVVGYGVDGLYLDQLATEVRMSYDPALKTIHGGDYWAKGSRRMSEMMYDKMRGNRPDAFLTGESFCEAYLNTIDGFLTLDILRMGWFRRDGWDVFPLMAMTYHDYAVNFGGDMVPQQDADFFAWQLGLGLTWGTQLMYSTVTPSLAGKYVKNNEFLREAAQAYHQVGKKFLTGGKWVKCALVPDAQLIGNAPVSVVSPEHNVTFSYKKISFPWHGPSVLASAWRAHDNTLGIIMTNIADHPVKAILRIDGAALKLADATLWNIWPLPVASNGKLDASMKTIELTLPARSIRMFQAGGDSAPLPLPLEDINWVLATACSKGTFAAQKVEGRELWGCVDSVVENDVSNDNTLTLLTPDGSRKPRRLKTVVKWGGSREGYGLPRAPDDKSFFLLQRTPYSLTVDGRADVSARDKQLCAQFSLPFGGVLNGPATAVFFTRGEQGKIMRHNGQVSLPAGEHMVVALYPGELTDAKIAGTAAVDKALEKLSDASDILTAISEFTLSVMEFVRNVDSYPQTTARMQLEERLSFAAESLTRLAVGINGRINMPQDWLAPALPLPFAVQLNIAKDKTARLVKSDFILRNQLFDKKINIKAQGAEPGRVLTAQSPMIMNYELQVPDDTLVEHLVPFQVHTVFESGGKSFGLPLSGWVSIDRPLAFKCKTARSEIPVGKSATVKFEINNISPYEIPAEILLELPKGWTAAAANPARISIPPCEAREVELSLTSPEDGSVSDWNIKCFIRYGNQDSTRMEESFNITLLPNFIPAAKTGAASPGSWQKFRHRRGQKILLYAKAGEKIDAIIRADQLSNNGTVYTLLGPDLEVLAEGQVEKGKSVRIQSEARKSGNYYLNIRSRAVRGGNTWRVRINSPAVGGYLSPLSFFADTAPLYVFVPKGAGEFSIAIGNDGPSEPVSLEILRPDGSTALKGNGDWSNNFIPIEVPSGMDGRIWTIKVDPSEDLQIRFSGDIVPCFSPTPSGVVKFSGQDSSALLQEKRGTSLLPDLVPFSKTRKTPPNWQNFRFRHKQEIVQPAKAGETLSLEIRTDKLGNEKRALVSAELLDPNMKTLLKEEIQPGQIRKLSFKVANEGNYYWNIHSPVNTWRIHLSRPALGVLMATDKQPLSFYTMTGPLHAFVPKGAGKFRIAMKDGGPKEPASLEIFRPDGTTAFQRNGNWSNEWLSIDVPPGMDNGIWIINIKPVQDLQVRLSGDISPFLSPAADGVLKPAEPKF